jgi:hypothetical protein
MSLAAHFQDETTNFADLDLGTARELIDAPAEVSDPIMRRAEAGETISQEEVKAAIRIRRADCIPVTLPPRPAINLVSASQSRFAEPPTKEPLIATSDTRQKGSQPSNDTMSALLGSLSGRDRADHLLIEHRQKGSGFAAAESIWASTSPRTKSQAR